MDKIIVERRSGGVLRVHRRPLDHRSIAVRATRYDPRLMRVRRVEAPLLERRGFKPMDNSLSYWQGSYRGYPVAIYFPPAYPAVPFVFRWLRVPPGFPNLRGDGICVEALSDSKLWTHDTSVDTFFEALESHPYFSGVTR